MAIEWEQPVLAVVGAACGSIATYFTQLHAFKSPLHLRIASLEAEILETKKRHDAEMAKLHEAKLKQESVISEQKAYIEKHMSRQAVLSKYTVDEETADLLKDGLHFCSPCFHAGGNSPPEIQMKKLSNGQYQCPVCGKPRRNVSFPTRGSEPLY